METEMAGQGCGQRLFWQAHDSVVLIDFGYACEKDAPSGKPFDFGAGCLGYVAPEETYNPDAHALTAQDSWGLGYIVYCLATGTNPGGNFTQMALNIAKDRQNLFEARGVSGEELYIRPALAPLLLGLLAPRPRRLSVL